MIVGAVVSICGPLWVRPVSDRLAALPAPSVMVARVEIDRGGRQVGGVLSGRHRVAEGQRAGAGAAGVGRGAAVVERQRRRAAATVTASLRFSVSVTVLPASRSPLDGDFDAIDRDRSASWCRSAGRSGSGRRATGWRRCRRRR